MPAGGARGHDDAAARPAVPAAAGVFRVLLQRGNGLFFHRPHPAPAHRREAPGHRRAPARHPGQSHAPAVHHPHRQHAREPGPRQRGLPARRALDAGLRRSRRHSRRHPAADLLRRGRPQARPPSSGSTARPCASPKKRWRRCASRSSSSAGASRRFSVPKAKPCPKRNSKPSSTSPARKASSTPTNSR